MFRAMISPTFRSTRLCVTAFGIMHPRFYRPATSWVYYTTSCTHSLVLLKMGEITVRNTLSCLELIINRYCGFYLVLYIICITDFLLWVVCHHPSLFGTTLPAFYQTVSEDELQFNTWRVCCISLTPLFTFSMKPK